MHGCYCLTLTTTQRQLSNNLQAVLCISVLKEGRWLNTHVFSEQRTEYTNLQLKTMNVDVNLMSAPASLTCRMNLFLCKVFRDHTECRSVEFWKHPLSFLYNLCMKSLYILMIVNSVFSGLVDSVIKIIKFSRSSFFVHSLFRYKVKWKHIRPTGTVNELIVLLWGRLT